MQPEWLGLISYGEGLAAMATAKSTILQNRKHVGQTAAGKATVAGKILGLEHKSVITLGKRARESIDLISSRDQLTELGIDVQSSDRGGQATLHAPGQLVVYPILDMAQVQGGVKDLVCGLLKATVRTLKQIGIEGAETNEAGTGVFVKGEKIAYCGLRISEGVSTHGISINICNDLEMFKFIRSCGVSEAKVTSVMSFGVSISCREVFEIWFQNYSSQQTFACEEDW